MPDTKNPRLRLNELDQGDVFRSLSKTLAEPIMIGQTQRTASSLSFSLRSIPVFQSALTDLISLAQASLKLFTAPLRLAASRSAVA